MEIARNLIIYAVLILCFLISFTFIINQYINIKHIEVTTKISLPKKINICIPDEKHL